MKKLDGMGDGIGDAFGKKSRNDFIHGIGVVVGGVTRLALALPKVLSLVADSVIHVGKAFADGIKSGEGFFSSIGKGAAGAAAAAAATSPSPPLWASPVSLSPPSHSCPSSDRWSLSRPG